MPPKVIARNADRTSGVLPVDAAARAAPAKPPAARLKLEVRRLPPALTLAEYEETLGDEWKLGNGKVDWQEYRQGKTRAPGSGKVSEQSRCYVHVVNDACVKEFEKRFLEVLFHDKAGTHKIQELKNLPPKLAFAPNQRTPLKQARHRTDNRQGTIDQDSEFIAFLEAETQPIAKPAALDAVVPEKEGVEIKSTPLIDDLRERKANKAKAAQAKAEKEKEKKAQATKSPAKDATQPSQKDALAKQQKIDQAVKEAAKALNKQVASKPQPKQAPAPKSKKQTKTQSPKPQNAIPVQASSPATTGPASPAPARGAQRPRGNTDSIKKMLQKDLGIKPKPQPAAQAPEAASTTKPVAKAPVTASSTSTKQAVQQSDKVAARSSSSAPANSAEPKLASLKAYLKHANPSQGITEALIQSALSQYGPVTNVTIDLRKGTAIAMFKDSESLKKALEAKRVSVANGAVEVLEFRDRSGGGGGNGGSRGGRAGGRAAGRGGKGNAGTGTTNANATPASAPAPDQGT